MYCRNCAKELHPQAVVCPGCGVPPHLEKKFCSSCGQPTQPAQTLCTACGASLLPTVLPGSKSKLVAGLLGLFLGGLGIHKFYLDYSQEGLIMLLVAVVGGLVTCGTTTIVMAVIGIIEAIIYLTKTDTEFEVMYVQNRRGWF